jgi:hypothetical protein
MTTRIIVKGDTFILCTFSFHYGPIVLESHPDAQELMKEIPNWLNDEDTLCFCRVGHWTVDEDGDPTDWTPRDIKTIFQITPYEINALDDDYEAAVEV